MIKRRFTYYRRKGSFAHGTSVSFVGREWGQKIVDATSALNCERVIVLKEEEDEFECGYTIVGEKSNKRDVAFSSFEGVDVLPENHEELMHELKQAYFLSDGVLMAWRINRGPEAIYGVAGSVSRHDKRKSLRPALKLFGSGGARRTCLSVGDVVFGLQWIRGQQTYIQVLGSFDGVNSQLVPRKVELTHQASLPVGFSVVYTKNGPQYKFDSTSLRIRDRMTLPPMMPTATENMSGIATIYGNTVMAILCGMTPRNCRVSIVSKIPIAVWRAEIMVFLRVHQLPLCFQKRDGGRGRTFPMCVTMFANDNDKRRHATQTTSVILNQALALATTKMPGIKKVIAFAKEKVTDTEKAKIKSIRWETAARATENMKKRPRENEGYPHLAKRTRMLT